MRREWDSRPWISKWVTATSAADASSAPTVAAITLSRMNGSWMKRLEAPTSRMMPVSRRRVNAVSRIVVATSRVEQARVITASTQE